MIERCTNKKKMMNKKYRKVKTKKLHLISYNYLKNIVKNKFKNKNEKNISL